MKYTPCPHCGCSDIVARRHSELHGDESIVVRPDGWYIICDASLGKPGCGAASGCHKSRAEARKAWERRAADPMTALKTEFAFKACKELLAFSLDIGNKAQLGKAISYAISALKIPPTGKSRRKVRSFNALAKQVVDEATGQKSTPYSTRLTTRPKRPVKRA